MEIDLTGWSGEGIFTQAMIDHLRTLDQVSFFKVDDAPSTRSDADYSLISNEIFVTFRTSQRRVPTRWLRIVPVTRHIVEKMMDMEGLAKTLNESASIGPPDYHDEGMIQYLRTERIVPPYQTRGYKLVELVRIYEAGAPARQ